METTCQIDLQIQLEEVKRFFQIHGDLREALRQDRARWVSRGVVEGRLVDRLADGLPGIKHYDPDLCKEQGGATPWVLACFALQHKEILLRFQHNPKIVIAPGVLFDRGYEDVRRTAEMLRCDDYVAREHFDHKWGSYRRYIMGADVIKYDPVFVQLKSDASHGLLDFWSEPLYPRILMVNK